MRVLRVAHHAVVDAWRERERALRSLGHDIRLLSAQRWNEGGRDLVLEASGDDFVEGVATLGTHPNGFVFDPRPLWRELGKPYDLIDLHEEPFALATAQILLLRRLRGQRAPYLLYSAQNIDKRYPVPIRWFERWALRGAAGVYVCNREAGQISLRKGLRGVAPLIPLGVDVERFRPAERGAPGSRPVVGYIGRLDPHKGVTHLIRAAAMRANWVVEISGDGAQRSELVALAQSLGIADRVHFLGFASGDELAERYRRLDVLAVPSLPTPGWLEQFCRVAVEAMASGIPVVASLTGAIPDVLDEAGVLVEPGDDAALAAGIDRALEADTWHRLRRRGLEHAQDFTWQRVAALQHDLYRTALGRADAAPRDRGVHVVVVAYGDPDLLAGALDELGGGYPITIVDNSSSTRSRALAELHAAHYIDPGTNLGFAAGVNAALRSLVDRGIGDDVLLLNPDARISADAVKGMQRSLSGGGRVAAVGATQTEPATGERVRVWWPFPHPGRAWLEAIGLGRLNRAHDFAIGSVLLLNADAIADVGLLDERFFLYAEEVDWQRRARSQGWRIEVADVEATHVGAGTGGDSTWREMLFHASGERYIRKHFGSVGWFAYRAATIVGAAARGVILPGERGDAARRRRDLYLHGPVRSLERDGRA